MTERLQKFLARAGVASRRKSEELISAGQVEVDGQVVIELGTTVDPRKQTVKVRGQVVKPEAPICILLHKPVSYVTTVSDPQGRRTVLDLLSGIEERVYPVGRLDYDTSGLLLLSNDGDLTYRLLHPKHHVEKVYRATILGMPTSEEVRRLETGVELEDGVTTPAKVTVLRNHPMESVIELTIHEGRNRQVRRMLEAVGHPVKRLKRIQFGALELGTLSTGEWRYLSPSELTLLYQSVSLDSPVERKQDEETSKGKSGHSKPGTKIRSKRHTRSESKSSVPKGRTKRGRGRDDNRPSRNGRSR